MTIAIHQPNYFPWLGFFNKIHQCDLFVFHDAVPFSASAFTKRCRVFEEKGSTNLRWLTVPVSKFSDGTPISEITIDESTDWRKKQLNALTNAYGSAPYFDEISSFVIQTLEETRNFTSLSELNIEIISKLCHFLGIDLQYKLSSDLPFRDKGSRFNLRIVKHFKGEIYLGGIGAMNYEDIDAFDAGGVSIRISDTISWMLRHPYDQMIDEFSAGLSIIDVLMFVGPQKTMAYIIKMSADI
jgi:WbqC-like protein family